jgi:hypothetical protein
MIGFLSYSLIATVTYSSLIQGGAMLSFPQTHSSHDEDQQQFDL